MTDEQKESIYGDGDVYKEHTEDNISAGLFMDSEQFSEMTILKQLKFVSSIHLGDDVDVRRVKGSRTRFQVIFKKMDLNFEIDGINSSEFQKIIILIKEVYEFNKNGIPFKIISDLESRVFRTYTDNTNGVVSKLELTKADDSEGLFINMDISKVDNLEIPIKQFTILIPLSSKNRYEDYAIKKISIEDLKVKHTELIGLVNEDNLTKYYGLNTLIMESFTKFYNKEITNGFMLIYLVSDDERNNENGETQNSNADGSKRRTVFNFLRDLYNVLSYSKKYLFDFVYNESFIHNEIFNSHYYYQLYDSDRFAKKSNEVVKTLANKLIKSKEIKGFDDVYGLEEIKEELKLIGRSVKYNYENRNNPIEIPKGILLVGPPGTGKTLLTEAFVKEFGLNKTNLSTFASSKGVDGSSIKSAFMKANNSATQRPSILFIDEMDKLFNDTNSQLVTILLEELSRPTNLIIVAAANEMRFHRALIRPGRFDKKFFLGDIAFDSKVEILKNMLDSKDINRDNINVTEVIKYLPVSANVSHFEAVIKAANVNRVVDGKTVDGKMLITLSNDLLRGVSDVVQFNERGRTTCAYHEAGHAALSAVLGIEIVEASIKKSGDIGGFVRTRIDEEEFWHYEERINHMIMGLGGWTSEKLLLKQISVGASGDFESFVSMVDEMVSIHGITDMNLLKYNPYHTTTTSNKLSNKAYKVRNKMMKKLTKRALKLTKKHKKLITNIAEELLIKNHLTSDEIMAIYNDYKVRRGIK